MDKKIIQEKIKELISLIFNIEKIDIHEKDENPDWDSLKHMNFILALEEEFLIKFSNSEIVKMSNFKNIFETIVSKMKNTDK